MPLEPAGVRFVADNLNNFLNMMADAAVSIAKIGVVSTTASKKLTDLALNLEARAIDINTAAHYMAQGVNAFNIAMNNSGDIGAEVQASIDLFGKNMVDKFDKMKSDVKGKVSSLIPDIFKTIASSISQGAKTGLKTGVIVGGIASAILSVLGTPIVGLPAGVPFTFIAGLQGMIIGALSGLGRGVLQAAKQVGQTIQNAFSDLFESIKNFITRTLPGLLGKIADVGFSIAKAMLSIGKTVVSATWNVLKTIGGVLKSLFDSIVGIFTGGGGAGRGGWRSLGDSIFGAMFRFEVLKQTVRYVVNEIKDLSKEATNAAAKLQTLTARINFLVASQIQARDKTLDFDSALAKTIPITQDLLVWIQKLALASPISVDDIAKTVSMSIAMGWTTEAAKEVTKSITDYTSATGLGSEISERIIYNFAQMKQQGKVTGTELRDLGRGAFMPINRILGIMYENLVNDNKAIGKTTESFAQFREEAAAGTVPVEGFFKAFNQFVGTYMPDAAYKMNYTFEAVMNNLQDLFKILLGWNVLGPLVQSLTKPLQDFIERFQSDEVLLGANRIGKALANMVENIKLAIGAVTGEIGKFLKAAGLTMPTVESIVKTIVKIGLAIKAVGQVIANFIDKFLMPFAYSIKKNFGDTFDNMRKDFFTWGAELVISFAKGMISAAAKFITAAIRIIASILTWWFHASVPNILPDIGIWGMDTINEWLKGFTQADFSVLDDMKGAVKSALDALVNLGVLTPNQSTKMYVDLSIELIKAMDELNRTGTVSVDIFKQLRDIGGAYGEDIAKLMELEIQLAIATERTVKAQKDYDNAVKKSAKSEARANQLIREYNTMVRKGADRNILKDKLKLVNVSELQLDANKRAEISAKTELDAAQEQQKAIEDTVKLQQSLIKEMTDLAQANKDVSGSAQSVAEAMEQLGADIGEIDFKTPFEDIDFGKWVSEATMEFDDWINKTLPKVFGTFWYDTWVSPDSDFQKALAQIMPSLNIVLGQLQTAWDTFANAIHLPTIDEIMGAWKGVPDITTTTLEPYKYEGGNAPTQLIGKPTLTTVVTPDWIGKVKAVLQKFSEDIQADGGIKAVLGSIASYLWGSLKTELSKALAPGSQFEKDMQALGNQLLTLLANIIAPVAEPEGKQARKTLTPGERIKNKFIELGEGIVQGILDGMVSKVTSIDWGKLVWELISNSFMSFFNIANFVSGWGTGNGEAIMAGISGGMIDAATTYDWVKNVWNLIISPFKKLFGIESPSTLFEGFGKDIIDGLANGIKNTIDSVIGPEGKVTVAFNNIINAIKSLFGADPTATTSPFYDLGHAIIQGIINGIKDAYNTLRTLFAKVGITLPDILSDIWDIKSPSKVFRKIGVNAMLGLREGIVGTSAMVNRSLANAIKTSAIQAAVMTAPMSAAPVYGGTTVNFGDVTINSGMDWAVFKAQVQRAIVEP